MSNPHQPKPYETPGWSLCEMYVQGVICNSPDAASESIDDLTDFDTNDWNF